jgi:N-methylhydantoinase A
MIVVGVDTGGTFTDLFLWDGEGGRASVLKLPSTPENPALAVLAGLRTLTGEAAARVVHGSTVATNALLERKGAPTAFVANDGFTDLIAIGRQNRARLYDLEYHPPPELAPAAMRFGAPGRIDAAGREIEALTEEQAERLARAVAASGAQSVAVCLLFSFLCPAHEQRLARALRRRGLDVSSSHEILAELREYERAATTLVNAYVAPIMRRYLGDIEDGLGPGRSLRVMQSNGGAITAATARREPVRTILSGPAAGAVGALELGRAAGFDKLIAFDMGGTSTDVCLLDGGLPLAAESRVAGLPVKTPMIGIHTVGAGGGSIARCDAGGALLVGPLSAGADPGPACYGRGEWPTVTDANVVLGRIVPDRFLGGTMPVHPERAAATLAALAGCAGLSLAALAEGVVAVANAGMERAIRRISVEKGFSPADFALFCFGGAGGLHAAYLARALGMKTVVAPRFAGILSALGMLLADVVKDYSRTVMLAGDAATAASLDALFAPLEARARADMAAEGARPRAVALTRLLDMRYAGQSFELLTPYAPDFAGAFHALHERTYGSNDPARPVEVVNIRLRATAATEKPRFPAPGPFRETIAPAAILEPRTAVFDGQAVTTAVYDRDRLLPGNRFAGPAVVTEYSATTLVPPFAAAEVDGHGNLILRLRD